MFDYKLKFSMDNFSGGFNNDILISRYQPYTGSLPVTLQSGGAFNGMLKASVFDLFEDIRFTGRAGDSRGESKRAKRAPEPCVPEGMRCRVWKSSV